MNILADAALPGITSAFLSPFKLTLYNNQKELSERLASQEILLCRSTLKVTKELVINSALRYVATASSGTDHIDKDFLQKKNIALIDAKGCNASSVADYVLATIAYLQKYKQFKGQKAGIIGLGAVGTKVAKRLKALNFAIIPYDPLKAYLDSRFNSASLSELAQSDVICIHANLHHTLPYPSKNLITESFLSQLQSDTIIINAARGGIVDETALLNKTSITYCSDVFANEPDINPAIINFSYLCTPHIAGHSLEAKYKAVFEVSQKIHHALNLPLPNYSKSLIPVILDFKQAKSWQDYILTLFNPMNETKLLKEASNKKVCFLKLRSNHQQRHDFAIYQDQLPEFIKPFLS